jgi:sulfur-oxidizing protein SoxZ
MAAAISTNPYFAFDAVVPEAGDFNFAWYDDDGDIYPATKSVKIA